MEKIIPRQKKDALIFAMGVIPTVIFLYFYGINVKILIEATFIIFLMFSLKVVFDYLYHSRISIGEEGIALNWFLHKKIIIWNDLNIETRVLNKDQKKIIFRSRGKKIIALKVDYLNESSFIDLIKKYCPQDHEFFKAISNYTKEKEIQL